MQNFIFCFIIIGLCTVQINGQSKILSEGEITKIKNKWFKVEECRLNRAYPVPCGSKLYYQLRDLACSIYEQNHDKNVKIREEAKDELTHALGRSYSDICCESACTVSEFIQACPTKW